jgi:hypothetical protein
MLKAVLALLIIPFAATASVRAQEPQVGRYQMVAVPASQSQTFPQTLLLDTATGQTWILYHETGQLIECFPFGFRPERIGLQRPCRPRLTLLASRADKPRHRLTGLGMLSKLDELEALDANGRSPGHPPQCAAGARPPSLTLRRLIASGTAASESSISTQNTST